MPHGETDTIFAIASGPGRTAITVLRLSGPETAEVVQTVAGGLPPARRLSLRRIRDPRSAELLDRALVAWLPGPGSFTGEDTAELHLHGGAAVRAAVLAAVAACPGCRPAEPGEFTRRAFLNGRLDLSEVEGLADLIDAETEAQRRQALRQMDGDLSRRVASWRDRLADALALCEATLDFSDEEDVPADLGREVLGTAAAVRIEVSGTLSGARRGERLREGFTVVIAGPPNAGKSTLLNAIAKRDAAIVSPIPGTTRDAIEIRCDLSGLPVAFVDTAGLRDTSDLVEREGVLRAQARIEQADLVLWLAPVGEDVAPPDHRAALIVRTKADLAGLGELRDTGAPTISAASGEGLAELLDEVERAAQAALGRGEDAVVTRERHRLALEDVVDCLGRIETAAGTDAPELIAEDLRLALRGLGRITGHVDVEAILDRIFSAFCIGK